MSTATTIRREDVLSARNPATGAELGRVPATPPEQVAASLERLFAVYRRFFHPGR
jgi:hypothetical protein